MRPGETVYVNASSRSAASSGATSQWWERNLSATLPERAIRRLEHRGITVYVSGLSNGLAIEEKPETGERLIKRKTLQINFVRPTDDKRPQITDIVPDDANGPAEKWIYRTVSSVKACEARETTSALNSPTRWSVKRWTM